MHVHAWTNIYTIHMCVCAYMNALLKYVDRCSVF